MGHPQSPPVEGNNQEHTQVFLKGRATRGAPRFFSRRGPQQKFSYIVASRVRNINLT